MSVGQIVSGLVILAVWLTVVGGAFALLNKRWPFATLPTAKRTIAYVTFGLAALALALICFLIWAFVAISFFCVPPGCF
ncbi:MAG: hypothetical protein JWM87_1296 [Candidatus Eremiobacteraeota bacterium]|nr:hypothetical protein [Candidatus Eremiobacteraeota bacterium]